LLGIPLLWVYTQNTVGENGDFQPLHETRSQAVTRVANRTASEKASVSSLSNSCYSHIWDLRCIRPYTSILKQLPSLPLLSTLNLTTVTLNSLYFKLPKSQINRLQQIQNCLARMWLKLLNLLISHPSYKFLPLTYKAARPRRRRISPTYQVEFPWSRSRRQTC